MNGPALVFVGVAVVSLFHPDLETGQTVIVEGDRITYAGPSNGATIPRDARRIDGSGRFLMPGLADMHVHLQFADELGVYLGHGITTVRNMRGAPEHLAWRGDGTVDAGAGPAREGPRGRPRRGAHRSEAHDLPGLPRSDGPPPPWLHDLPLRAFAAPGRPHVVAATLALSS